jgi:ribosomal protein S18 acetylase RimI-like enzyme
MEVSFRDLIEEDIPQVLSFFQELKEENAGVSYTEYENGEEIKEWIDNPNIYVYAALYGEKVVGVFKGRSDGGNKKHSAFLTCAVDGRYRGKNIAKNLTFYGVEKLKENGIKIARAYVYSDNKPSINTILSCGFQFSGNVLMHHFDEQKQQYVDDLIFHKIL